LKKTSPTLFIATSTPTSAFVQPRSPMASNGRMGTSTPWLHVHATLSRQYRIP
jgi:hypothetical protein